MLQTARSFQLNFQITRNQLRQVAYLVCCLLVAGGTVSGQAVPEDQLVSQTNPTDSAADNFQHLLSELENTKQLYSKWGISRQTRRYGTIALDPQEDRVRSIDWLTQTPVRSVNERFLRSGERFRSDCFAPEPERRFLAFDGIYGRVRDHQTLFNGPLPKLTSVFEDDFAQRLPHSILIDYFYAPNLVWLFGRGDTPPMSNRSFVFGKIKISQQEVDGHPCWRVRWRALRDETGEIFTDCDILMSRERNLLPIRQVFRTPVRSNVAELRDVRTDEFQRDPASGLWFPKEVTAACSLGSDLQVTRYSFQLSDLHADTEIYSQAPIIAAKHSKPPKATVAQYARYPVLSDIRRSLWNSSSGNESYRRKTAGSGLIGLFALFAVVSFALRMTRLGRLLREFIGRHRTMLGVTGIILTVCVGLLASYPPGWMGYGLAMMFAGVFGVGWIGFSMLMIGEKKVSIKVALFAAACIAIFFGGYSKGIKRMQVRQRMISEVRDGGGQISMGLWRLDEDGLFLPGNLRRLLGEAWSGRANRAAIEQESFTEKNVNKWCLDEVQWLGIASQQELPFDLDSRALANINRTDSLWTLHVEDGYLGDDAFGQLSRFNRLIDLYYDCQYRPVSSKIAAVPELERVWLTNAVVDEALFESLRGIKTLEYVTLIKPRIGNCDQPVAIPNLLGIEIQHATLNPQDLNSLGNLPTELVFVNCKFNVPISAEVSLPATTTVSIQTGDLNDQSLLKFCDSPKLTRIRMAGTNVSVDGVEAFSGVRPEVSISLE